VGVGLSYGKVGYPKENETTIQGVPGIEVGYRYGVTSKDEVGLRTNTGANLVGDYKRALVDSGDWLLSVGAGLGYSKVTVTLGSESTSTNYIDMFFPVYVDYNFSEDLAWFVTPKVGFTRVSSSGISSSAGTFGSSTGIRTGKDSGVIGEVGFVKSFEDGSETLWQILGGYYF
jgi:hypothetical protein